MKRRALRLIVCAAITALTLFVAACGGSDDAKTADTTVEIEEKSAFSDGYTTLEDYYNDPSVKAQLDDMFSDIETEGLSLNLDMKGNEFIVTVRIEDNTMIVDGLAEVLEEGMEEQADELKEQVKEFDKIIGEEGACTVTMRYTDPDGNAIAEKSFKAD